MQNNHNHNHNSGIELSSQHSLSQIVRRYPQPPPPRFSSLPQQDQESSAEPQRRPQRLQRARSIALEDKLKACVHAIMSVTQDQAARIAISLIIIFYIIGLGPLYVFTNDWWYEKSHIGEIRGALESMAGNLIADPIMDIQIIGKESTCPDDFQPLKLGIWHGTVTGCLCENGEILSSPCSSKKCKKIPRAHPVEIYELDELIWCGKRAVLGADYVKKAECPSGYNECYPGGCFKGECPVTKVEVASTGEAAHRFGKSKEKYITLAREQGELPLINIQMTPNDLPCFNKNLYAKSSYYNLSSVKPNGCDGYGFDSHFSKQLDDSLSTFDSFTQDLFRYSVMNLPDFEKEFKKTTSVLSWRTRMMTHKNDYCLNLDEVFIQNSIKTFNQSFISFGGFLNPLLAHLGVLLACAIIFCYSCFAKQSCFGDLKELLTVGIAQVLLGNYSPLVFKAFSHYDDYGEFKLMRNYFIKFDSLECFGGGQGSSVISDYLEILAKGDSNYLMFFGLLISNGLALLTFGWYLIVQKWSSSQNSNSS